VVPTRVRTGASIGAGAVIVCGTVLGEHCMVAAGAVVTTDVPPHALVVGVPARRRSWVCSCGATLDAELRCPACGVEHEASGPGLRAVVHDESSVTAGISR
jgi:tetrahydrodipicolinate N-succinyltransferase